MLGLEAAENGGDRCLRLAKRSGCGNDVLHLFQSQWKIT
jgi:hypothetical protein